MCEALGSTPHAANDIPSSLFAPQALEDQGDVSKPTCTYQAHREHSLSFPLSSTRESVKLKWFPSWLYSPTDQRAHRQRLMNLAGKQRGWDCLL